MHLFDTLLVLASVGLLVPQLLRRAARPWWQVWVALAATPLMFVHLIVDGYRVLLIPTYAVAVFFLLRTIMWLLGEDRATATQGPLARAARRGSASLAIVLILASAGLSVILAPLTDDQDDIARFLLPERVRDLSGLTWAAGFDSLASLMRDEYAFGAWKAVPWDTLHERTWARIAAAQALGDHEGYVHALRGYGWAIPDGQVAVDGDEHGLREAGIGGGYGLGVTRLDDGRTIAHLLLSEGSAARAGVRRGAEVLFWNDRAVDSAVGGVDLLWAPRPPATTAEARLVRERLLTRAPVGTRARVVFRNPGEPGLGTAELVAEEDDLATLRAGEPGQAQADSVPVGYRVLSGEVGYLRIRRVLPARGQLLPARTVREAMALFRDRRVRGVIVDLRGNSGGSAKLVTQIARHFYDTPAFYEEVSYYRAHVDSFERKPRSTLRIQPRGPRAPGAVVVLVDRHCAGACEGLAQAIGRVPGTTVVGWQGTAASFGKPGGAVRMPGGLVFRYPDGRSLDSLGVIQLDSDSTGSGGVVPGHRVPRTDSTVLAAADGRDVVLEHALAFLRAGVPPADTLRAPTPSSSSSAGR